MLSKEQKQRSLEIVSSQDFTRSAHLYFVLGHLSNMSEAQFYKDMAIYLSAKGYFLTKKRFPGSRNPSSSYTKRPTSELNEAQHERRKAQHERREAHQQLRSKLKKKLKFEGAVKRQAAKDAIRIIKEEQPIGARDLLQRLQENYAVGGRNWPDFFYAMRNLDPMVWKSYNGGKVFFVYESYDAQKARQRSAHFKRAAPTN